MTNETKIQCDNCGFEGARARRASRSCGEGSDLLVVEGIPIVSCPRCGESYMTAEVLHQLERLKALRGSIAEDRPVDVVRFVDASSS